MTYDSLDGYVLLFGGVLSNSQLSGQTWAFALGYWTNLTSGPGGNQPSPRWDAMLADDPVDGYVVLFGGCRGPSQNSLCVLSVSDTWAFSSGAWKALLPSRPPGMLPPNFPPTPSSRWDAAMTWDPEVRNSAGGFGAVVLEGGASGLIDNPPPPGPAAQLTINLFSDTWEYLSSSWTQINGQVSPPPMYGARLVNDPDRFVTILFGGTNWTRYDSSPTSPPFLAAVTTSGIAFNDTWEFSRLGVWSKLSFPQPVASDTPPPRWDFSMGYDSFEQAIIMFGGTDASGFLLTDVWQFVTPGAGWFLVAPNNPGPGIAGAPPARWASATAYDGRLEDHRFIVAGGTSPSGSVLSDAWAMTSPGVWKNILPPLGTPAVPVPRYGASITYDDALREAVLFGGESCSAASCTFLGDTWEYDHGAWRQISVPAGPPDRFGAVMAYNTISETITLFGGCGVTCPLGDTWEFYQGGWTQLFPPIAPPGRYFASLSWDAAARALILFGGCEGAAGPCPTGDTWSFGTTWVRLPSPSGGGSPSARFGQSATSMGSTRGIMIFGGQGASGPLQDTWTYTTLAKGWVEINSALVPPPRIFGTLAYDPVDGRLTLFGGCEPGVCPTLDPWVYNLNPPPQGPPGPGPPPPPYLGPWSFFTPSGPIPISIPPGPSFGTAGLWDPVDSSVGYILFFGGRMQNGVTFGATGSFVGTAWTELDAYV